MTETPHPEKEPVEEPVQTEQPDRKSAFKGVNPDELAASRDAEELDPEDLDPETGRRTE